MKRLHTIFAIIVCKLSRRLLRLMGRGGTSIPGRLAVRLFPDLLGVLGGQIFTIIITGTNGKTTSSRMLEQCLKNAGIEAFANRSGANMLTGITAEFVANATWTGQMKRSHAIIECDEFALKEVSKYVDAKIILVTNIFKDQLDRFGEITHVVNRIREGIENSPHATVCINADCSLSVHMMEGLSHPVCYYGVETALYEGETAHCSEAAPCEGETAHCEIDAAHRGKSVHCEGETAPCVGEMAHCEGETAHCEGEHGEIDEGTCCPKCGSEYLYSYRTYGHLGDYYCPQCGRHRPAAHVGVTEVVEKAPDTTTIRVRTGEQISTVTINLPGVYNIYNAAGVIAVAEVLNLGMEVTGGALKEFSGGFGRMERITLGNQAVHMILVKNPIGFSLVLRYLADMTEPVALVFCLNDRYGDGRDISWIWDVDEGILADMGHRLTAVYCSGIRADDMAVWVKSSGMDEEKIHVEYSYDRLLEIISRSPVPVYIMPTYTAMLDLRGKMEKQYGLDKFWE